MKTLEGYASIAKALGVSIPTARKIVVRDMAISRAVQYDGPHPIVGLCELSAAINGRTLVMRRGRKKKLY